MVLSERTLTQYEKEFNRVKRWCAKHYPCEIPMPYEAIAMWLGSEEEDGGALLKLSSLGVALSAIASAHRELGYPFDRRHPVLGEAVQEVRDTKSGDKSPAKIISESDKVQLIEALNPNHPRDARDGALLYLAWHSGLLRAELVGLDWFVKSSDDEWSRGVIEPVGDAFYVTLKRLRNKGKVEFGVDGPCAFWLKTWADIAELAPGSPFFRGVGRNCEVSAGRMEAGSVSYLVKERMYRLARLRGVSHQEATTWSRQFSSRGFSPVL